MFITRFSKTLVHAMAGSSNSIVDMIHCDLIALFCPAVIAYYIRSVVLRFSKMLIHAVERF